MPDMEYEDIRYMLSTRPAQTQTSQRAISRRSVLKAIAAGVGIASIPWWLLDSAGISVAVPAKVAGLGPDTTGAPGTGAPLSPTDAILIVLELGGGNDGLNTIVPVGDGRYYDMRGALAIPESGALALGGGMAFHPKLQKLKTRFDAGKVAVVQGVGHSQPNLSHFESMATWMAGWAKDSQLRTGWLGRYIDEIDRPDDLNAIAISNAIPFHMQGAKLSATCIPKNRYGVFGVNGETPSPDDAYWDRVFDGLKSYGSGPTGLGTQADKYAAATTQCMDRSETISKCYPPSQVNQGQLAQELVVCANLVNADLGIRVLGVTLESFDTHGGQLGSHGALMKEIDDGIDALFSNLTPEMAARTTVMTFSEFGRRVAPTGSGTDHGTAGPMLVIGDRVQGGLIGKSPSLSDLDANGNMKASIEFHSVYASIIENCLGADSTQLLGKQVDPLPLFA